MHTKKVLAKTPHLFIRLNDFADYDFIEEHQKVIQKKGYTWLLKMGKSINQKFIEALYKNESAIILKTSAKKGNKFYYCKLLNKELKEEKISFPDYYKEYLENDFISFEEALNNGFWFKVESITLMSYECANRFEIISSKKNMVDCAISTRVVHMYVENKEYIEI